MKTKGQEEMVGFVLIIIIVTIIALFFFWLMLRHPAQTQESSEVESFLQASKYYTTSCKNYNLQYLAEACYKQETCEDQDSCLVLNETIKGLIKSGFNIGKEAKYKAYIFSLKVNNNSISTIRNGNITNDKIGSEVVFRTASGENMRMILELSI